MRPFNPLMLHLLALVLVVLWSIDLTALNVTLLMTDLHCCCVSITNCAFLCEAVVCPSRLPLS